MQISTIDLLIIALYLITTVVIGIVLSKRAAKNMDAYYLGGKSLPWYMLGLSNASGMFDVSGTMWMVYLCFTYGMKSAWIPWLWPVFNQIFLMVFLAAWLRRSEVLTGAAWIRFRFGDGQGGTLSHIIVVIFAIIGVLGFLSYGFIGIGKFISIFLPWDIHPNVYGIIFTAVATIYVMFGGMLSIVWNDVLQFFIMTLASVTIGLIAMSKVNHAQIMEKVPEGWSNLFFGRELGLDWSNLMPQLTENVARDGYSLFMIFFAMMLFKGIFVAAAGPAPNYDMQKILSTKSPKEASKMSGLVSVVLLFPRYMLITGLTVLVLVYYSDNLAAAGASLDFENILPIAIREFVPVGLFGLIIAGLLSAFISTFAATVNAAPAYIVNDIYLRYINPKASNKRLIYLSYAISALVVVLSTIIGLLIANINVVILWITSALWGGYTAANLLKWYWWRFNGYGYFWGMISGIGVAILIAVPFFKDALFAGTIFATNDIYFFPFILLISLAGCFLGSYLTPADDMERLTHFYRKTRPWGFWGPVRDAVMAADPSFAENRDFRRDMFNIAIGIVWQMCLTVIPMYLIIGEHYSMLAALGILVVTTAVLKKTWYDKLQND